MSELVIRSGGIVEVDTSSLRAVAADLRAISAQADDLARTLAAGVERLWDAGVEALFAQTEVGFARAAVARTGSDAASVADAVERAAQLYEAVELLAERAVAEAGDDAAAVRRIDGSLAAVPAWAHEAAEKALSAGVDRGALGGQAEWGLRALGPQLHASLSWLTVPLLGGLDRLGRGRIGSRERLAGPVVPVDVRRVHTSEVAPPASLAAAAARIPHGGDSRVRVERYSMASGPAQYAVYIAGTQSLVGRDAFDMRSNLELYGGARSASYDAVVRALREAGAGDGDVVHAFGHSQGAMVAERLALEGGYDVRTLVSFGSPVQAEVGDSTLSVSVRHTDDPVATLQSGGHPSPVGAPGGFVVERLADPNPGPHDLAVPSHHMAAYAETAALVDASADPRTASLREVFAGLGRAQSGRRDDFSAERSVPRSSDAG